MLELIKKILGNDNAVIIIGFLVTVLVSFITASLTAKNTKKHMTTDFFKREGIKKQEVILEFWSTVLLFNLDVAIENYKKQNKLYTKLNDTEIIKHILKDSYIYSSNSTIKAVSRYQQYAYKLKPESEEEKKKIKKLLASIHTLVLPARIIKKMKFDFTGEKIDELELLKIKINDLDTYKRIAMRIVVIYYDLSESIIWILLLVMLTLIII